MLWNIFNDKFPQVEMLWRFELEVYAEYFALVVAIKIGGRHKKNRRMDGREPVKGFS